MIANFAASPADPYRIEPSQQLMIDKHGVCSKDQSTAIFVPAKAAGEWNAFRTNASGITQAACP